jgi:Uma2 family endonuclease
MDSPTTRHEFLDGEIYAMAGGTEDHSALAAEVLRILGNAVMRGGPCRVHTSDLRIYVPAVRLATFPDGSVICGPLERHPAGPETTAINPTVLVEVTSDSSEEYDTGDKLEMYKTIPTLREYVIVSHLERRITVHRRDHGEWTANAATAGERVTLASVGAELVTDDLYRVSSIG